MAASIVYDTVITKSRNLYCLVLVLTLTLSAPVAAQPPANVPASPAAAPDTAPAADAIDVGPAVESNPAVRAALELPRKTPADHFQAVIWLIDLDRAERAKPILEELAKLQLSDAQRAELVTEFGSSSMLRLAQAKVLAPAAAQFADACMAAAAAAANNPQRIATLITQLTDPSAEVRQLAAADLAAAGEPGAVAALETLARESDPDRRAKIATAAARMQPLVVGPLLAMFETNDQQLRQDIVQLLRHLGVAQAAPLILNNTVEAERALNQAISRYREGTPAFAPDEVDRVRIWNWDDNAKKLSVTTFSADDAQIVWLARLASELSHLRPDNRDYHRQALVLGLEVAASATTNSSIAAQLVTMLREADTNLLSEALAEALQADYDHAAESLARKLGERNQLDVLYTSDAQPSPLAIALVHPNRRVRFAALGTIMALDPPSPYPGSSRLPEALMWFSASEGERHALVGMPTLAAASNLAGMLAAHDLAAQPTNRGRDAVDIALEMPDLEMMFVDMNIIVPDIRQVLYELRIHPTTGQIPIALLAADGRLEEAHRLAVEHDRVIAVPRPHSAETLADVVERLNDIAGRDAVPADERTAQAAQARDWIDQLRSADRPFYKFRFPSPLNTVETLPADDPALLPEP